jgi:hypothetical protein
VSQIEFADEASRDGMPKAGVGQPECAIWKMTLQSCDNPRNRDFKRCGERGIRVCDRWLGAEGFANFLVDVGPQPFAGARFGVSTPISIFEQQGLLELFRRDGRISFDKKQLETFYA